MKLVTNDKLKSDGNSLPIVRLLYVKEGKNCGVIVTIQLIRDYGMSYFSIHHKIYIDFLDVVNEVSAQEIVFFRFESYVTLSVKSNNMLSVAQKSEFVYKGRYVSLVKSIRLRIATPTLTGIIPTAVALIPVMVGSSKKYSIARAQGIHLRQKKVI